MNETADLREAFDDVADALESHFEDTYGPECGLSCGGFIRAYRDLLTPRDESAKRVGRVKELENRAEAAMLLFFLDHQRKQRYHVGPFGPSEPASSTYPPPYDPGPMS